MTQLLPPKKEVALALLERSNVDVYLDPRAKGVVVPPQFRKEPRLILKIGLNMPVPIPDLRLDDESMSCTLSFNRAKFFCVVPWLSVFAMVGDDGRGMVWPDDVPQELAVRVVDEPSRTPESAPAASPVPSSRGGKGKSRLAPDTRDRGERSGGGDESAASDRGGPRSKKPRERKKPLDNKKDDGGAPRERPVLHAVPPPEKSAPRVEKLDERRESNKLQQESKDKERRGDNASTSPATPRVSGADSRADSRDRPPPSARPKRELPPYLRVVK